MNRAKRPAPAREKPGAPRRRAPQPAPRSIASAEQGKSTVIDRPSSSDQPDGSGSRLDARPRRRPRPLAAAVAAAWTVAAVAAASPPPASPPASPEEPLPDAETLLEQVKIYYRSAPSYDAAGKALTQVIEPQDGRSSSVGVSFSLRLARPRLYRIVWTQHQDFARSATGALWNDGEGPFLYLGENQAYSALPSDQMGFSAAAGASMGVAYLIPELFFGFAAGEPLLDRLEQIEDHGMGAAGGRPCRIVAARLPTGVDYRFWIALDRPEIVQIENALGGRTTTSALPALSEEKRARVLENMGLQDTPENQARVQEWMERAREVMRRVRGTSRQTHTDIDMMQPRPAEDFTFTPPPDARRAPSVLSPGSADEDAP